MRFHIGSIPETPDFDPLNEGWHGIREPNPVMIQFLALPVAILVVACLLLLVLQTNHGLIFSLDNIWLVLITLLLLFPFHELLHASIFPRFGFTSETIIGFWPGRLLLYACNTGIFTKPRYLLVTLMPFFVLTVLPAFYLLVARPSQLNTIIASSLLFISITNAAAASGDIIGFFLVLLQVPAKANIRSQGWKTYWIAKNTPQSEDIDNVIEC
jgi:hypothetical protein